MKDKILIVGGYGKVGGIISEHLAKQYPYRVIVAGRNFKKAKSFTDKIENGSIPKQFDVHSVDFSLLNEIQLVVMCIDQTDIGFVKKCVDNGIHYIDITANNHLVNKIEKLDAEAKLNCSSVILSVGLAPGLTNLLAKQCANQLSKIKLIDIFILLGIGEKHGDAAYRWTFDNFHANYKLANFSKKIKSVSLPKKATLLGKRNFYTLNFSDQHTLSKTLNAKKVISRMAFDSKLLTMLIRLLRTLNFTILFKNKFVQNSLIKLFNKFNVGSDLFAVKVVAEDNNGELSESSITGNGEGKITAFVAIEVTIHILEKNTNAGIIHIDQLIDDVPQFLNKLKSYDETLKIELDN